MKGFSMIGESTLFCALRRAQLKVKNDMLKNNILERLA